MCRKCALPISLAMSVCLTPNWSRLMKKVSYRFRIKYKHKWFLNSYLTLYAIAGSCKNFYFFYLSFKILMSKLILLHKGIASQPGNCSWGSRCLAVLQSCSILFMLWARSSILPPNGGSDTSTNSDGERNTNWLYSLNLSI